jgi:hypothetical protein
VCALAFGCVSPTPFSVVERMEIDIELARVPGSGPLAHPS